MEVDRPSVVWQSDITYITISDRHYYAVLIIDVYTKKIVGYKVSDNMRAQANKDALNMALRENDSPLIHHSDRGKSIDLQRVHWSSEKERKPDKHGTLSTDNAYAERINRTIKEEYLDHWKPKDFGQLKRMMAKALTNYNYKRLHNSINRISP